MKFQQGTKVQSRSYTSSLHHENRHSDILVSFSMAHCAQNCYATSNHVMFVIRNVPAESGVEKHTLGL